MKDLKILLTYTEWHRKGFRYQFVLEYKAPLLSNRIVVSYDWITYKLIRWYHGQPALDMQITDRIEKLKNELEHGV